MISVLGMLNFAPEARHHLSGMDWSVEKESSSDKKTVVSSANRKVMRRCMSPGTWKPWMGEHRSSSARGSIARSKRRQERGSPCRTPLVTWYGSLRKPLIMTWVCAES